MPRAAGETVEWHLLPPEETLDRLDVDRETGLTEEEAARRLAQFGPNELKQAPRIRPWQILLQQFTEPLVLVLVAAAAVSGFLWLVEDGPGREPLPYDSLVILAIVLLNGFLGFFQEYRAEQAVEALQKMAAPLSVVRRNGQPRSVEAKNLVPGDILLLEAGVRVPADGRLLYTANLEVEEAALTGESVPVRKGIEPLSDPDAPLGDRRNMIYMGSVVTYGRGEAVVTATGMHTEMGAIAELIQSVEEEETPLQRELGRVGKQLGGLVLAICLIVTVTGVLREGHLSSGVLLEMFLFGVALAVAAIPEGLPAIVTAVLALGVRRMADRNAIVRRLPAVETLGSATVICSDKTGTLTRNEMTVRRILLGVDQVLHVEGAGYAPAGGFSDETGAPVEPDEHLESLLRGAALNNDARLVQEDGAWSVVGDPTEGALLTAAAKAGLDPERLSRAFPRIGEIPFSSERKRMTTLHRVDGTVLVVVKGAPDVLIHLCNRVRRDGQTVPLTQEDRYEILRRNEAFAGDALRTLGIATRILPKREERSGDYRAEEVEQDLVWEGLIGMIDPPRPEVKASVALAREAGIRTIMITGDHAATALAIARELGITDDGGQVITGGELASMDDAALEAAVQRVDVYARVNPEHKLRIVRALKAHGEVVAMTGDGVNDAPALRQADIGVAMGITGTDVSKEAGDMVLADDNFATIVAAIEEGRTILDNLRKFIRYLLSSNAGEVMTMFFALLLAAYLGLETDNGLFFLPLLAVQILWINLVTDGGPALALGVDPPEPDVMARPPRRQGEPIIDRAMWMAIGVVGLVMTAGVLFVLDAYLPGGLVNFAVQAGDQADLVRWARTVAFTTLVLFQLFNVFNCRSANRSIFQRDLFRNKWLWAAVLGSLLLHLVVLYWSPLQHAFETTPLTWWDWTVAALVASSVVVVMEVLKALGIFVPRRAN